MLDVEDVGEHASSAQEASLRFTDPFIEDGFENQTKSTSDDAIVSIDDGKRSGLRRSEDSPKDRVNERRFVPK